MYINDANILQTARKVLFTAAQDGDVATVRTLLRWGSVDVNEMKEVGVFSQGIQC